MQDIQRILTGTFGKSLLNIFESALQKAGYQHDLPEAMLRQFIQAEDIGRRAYVWHSHFAENSSAAHRWHKVYAVEVNKFIATLSDTQKLSLQQDLFRPELTAGKLILYWLVREECPGYSYALNRFLTLVLIALAPNNSIHFFSLAKITKIEADSRQAYHTCGSYQNCTGIPHNVHVECPDNSLSPILSAIDLILLRHGATWENSIIFKKLGSVLGVLPSAPEQMVAYDLPERP